MFCGFFNVYPKGGERMAFKKAQKITLSDLDTATKEYEVLLKKAEKTPEKEKNIRKMIDFFCGI